MNSATQVDGRIAAEPVRWSIAGAFLESLTARDYGRLASTLAPRVRFRALQNEGPLEWHGRAEVAEVFRSWFGDADWFEVVDATIGGIAARLQMTWRIRLRPAPFDIGDSWHLIEQHACRDHRDDPNPRPGLLGLPHRTAQLTRKWRNDS